MGFLSSFFGKTDQSALIKAIKEGAILVDVRTAGEFASGSVQGAINIPLDTIQQQLAKFKGKQTIVVFCQSGNRSSLAKRILTKSMGLNVVDGGSWKNVKELVNY